MEKYIHFKALDFAEDPSFIDWVQSGFVDGEQAWNLLKKEHPSLSVEIEEAIEIISIFNIEKDAPIDKSKEAALFSRIEESISKPDVKKEKKQNRRSITRYLAPLAMAAAIAALVMIYLPQNQMNTFATTNKAKVEHQLPDNSSVLLDAHSEIAYDESSFQEARRVTLEGQAFFKIQKGKPFIVETKQGDIEVLGTTFNVNQNSGLEVHCVTGKVLVSNANSSVLLTKGEMCTQENNLFKKKAKGQADLAWFKTKFDFENDKLEKVIQKLEEEYQITIQTSAEVRNTNYTGFFETGDLEASLKAITWPLRLNYEMDEEIVKINKQ